MAEQASRLKRPRIVAVILCLGFIFQGLCEIAVNAALMSGNSDSDAPVYSLQMLIGAALVINLTLLMFWVWRIVRNTELSGIRDLSYTANWSVGWWFIPVANLFAPYIMLSEVYRANHKPEGWRKRDHPAPVVLLWLATLAQTPLGIMMRFITNPNGNIDPHLLQIAMYGFGAVRVLCLLIIVIRIGGFQKRIQAQAPIIEVF